MATGQTHDFYVIPLDERDAAVKRDEFLEELNIYHINESVRESGPSQGSGKPML